MNFEKTIFLVDDDADDLFLMGEAISELNLDINVCYASNGRELLEMLSKDVENAFILIDVNMPIMNGIETLNAIYANPALKHLPSILISTNDSADLRKVALDAGAMQFICKPIHYDGYMELIKRIYECF